ncbi:hypothetical protein BH10PSE16_BH10PSE16_30540 [soil metagenome]
MRLSGIGETTASAMLAMIGNGHEFKCGRQFAAWLGLVPGQYSSGSKARLGHITKAGDPYMRSLLVLGARAVLNRAKDQTDSLSRWALGAGPGRAARLLARHRGHRSEECPDVLGYAGAGRAFRHARLSAIGARIQETRKN